MREYLWSYGSYMGGERNGVVDSERHDDAACCVAAGVSLSHVMAESLRLADWCCCSGSAHAVRLFSQVFVGAKLNNRNSVVVRLCLGKT